MKTVFSSLILSAALFVQASTASAVVHEIKSMSEITSSVTRDTLLIFDLDNTIVEPAQSLGSDQWFEHGLQELVRQGMPKEQAVPRMMKTWMKINAVSEIRPVEALTPALIHRAQARGIKVMGLTARPSEFGDGSRRQLASIKVDLSRTAPARGSFELEDGVLFGDGIMAVTGKDKGVALVGFLKRIGYKPRRVVFVDDKAHNVAAIERALEAAGIEHISFRYGAADKRVESFDPEIAAVQARWFGRILDDEAAARLR